MTTEILGDEFDEGLRLKLGEVLHRFGACNEAVANHELVGSQELVTMAFDVGGELLQVEWETYVGLSIRGPAALVRKIKEAVLGQT